MGRPTVEGVADLITGTPLVQVTDLELPFDGAVFRLKRTRSSNHAYQQSADTLADKWDPAGTDKWWDWVGQGWMASENPILLIDSKLPDAVGDGPDTCWLILDAHHSIPFQLVESNHKYEAPPRFRATMTYSNGTRAAINGERTWNPAPTEYKVSLYDGALVYTFVAIRDDIPPKGWYSGYELNGSQTNWAWGTAERPFSFHDRPLFPNRLHDLQPSSDPRHLHDPYKFEVNRGFGIPHYAVCTRIQDRYGHEIQIEYSKTTSRSMDDSTSDCIECQQDCLAKGQIRSVKLLSNGQVKWSLLYVHRTFAGTLFKISTVPMPAFLREVSAAADPDRYALHGYNAMDRIYVYEGDVDLSALSANPLRIPFTDTSGFLGGPDPLTQWSAPTPLHNWKHLVRYQYNLFPPVTEPGQYPELWRTGWAQNRASGPPLLVATSVQSRSAAATGSPSTSRTKVFSYADGSASSQHRDAYLFDPASPPLWQERWIPWLNAVFSESDVAKLLADAPTLRVDAQGQPTGEPVSLKSLALRRDSQNARVMESELAHLLAYASLRVDAGDGSDLPDVNSAATPVSPNLTSLVSDVTGHGAYVDSVPLNMLRYDNHKHVVRDVTVRTAGGERSFRLHRFVVHPNGNMSAPDLSAPTERLSTVGTDPMASVFVNPYFWHSFTPWYQEVQVSGGNSADPTLCQPPAATPAINTGGPAGLQLPRFIVVIDEFPSRNQMTRTEIDGAPSEPANYDQPGGTKAGQLSRRVVQINAWGYVLQDQRWDYKADGVAHSGSGVGQKFIYKTVRQLADAGQLPGAVLPAACPLDPRSEATCDPGAPSPEFVNELLLVEQRSVGWAVANNGGQGADKGLIYFHEFGFVADASLSFEEFPWSSRLQELGSGVKEGTGGVKLFTQQTMYDPFNPGNPLCQIEFVEPTTSLLSSIPAYTPVAGLNATHFRIARDSDTSVPPYQRRIVNSTTIGPPIQQRPGGNWYYPIEAQVYGTNGTQPWAIKGLVRNPDNPSANDSDGLSTLIFRFTESDGYGRPMAIVDDAVLGQNETNQLTGDPIVVPSQVTLLTASGTVSVAPVSPSPHLRYVTSYMYDDLRLTDILYPSGKRYAHRWVLHNPSIDEGDEWIETFEFHDLVRISGSSEMDPGATFVTRLEGKRTKVDGPDRRAEPTEVDQVFYPDPLSLTLVGQSPGSNVLVVPTYQLRQGVKLARDANGRARRADKLEFVYDSVLSSWVRQEIGSKEINDLGEVYRELEIGGNITRSTRNPLGQVLRVYRGTWDKLWGNEAELSENPQPLPSDPNPNAHDMVLVERAAYGSGIADCWLPTSRWVYRNDPEWARTSYHGDPPSIDLDGYETRNTYDWRRRAVRTDIYDRVDPQSEIAERLGTTLTFLDHADRVTLVVTFGRGDLGSLPPNIDPSLFAPSSERPSASEFFSLPLRPLAIHESFYGHDGSTTEERDYDVAWDGTGEAPPYQASRRLRGFTGTEVFSQNPGSPTTLTVVDGIGRAKRIRTVLPGPADPEQEFELSTTESVFDAEGNVIETVHLERSPEAQGSSSQPTLSAGVNAVRTRVLNWYDISNRLTASVELGTEASTLTNAPGPGYARQTDSPAAFVEAAAGSPFTISSPGVAGLPAGSKVRLNRYDDSGKKTHEAVLVRTSPTPIYRVTRTDYDANGRVAAVVENAPVASSVQNEWVTESVATQSRTEHGYRLGRLERLTAFASDPTNPLSAGRQTTLVHHGADIVNDDFEIVSADNTLPAYMRLPHRTVAGAAGNVNDIHVRYDFERRVAERIDARGIAFRYRYDARGRLASIEIGHYAESDPAHTGTFTSGYPAPAWPTATPVDRVEYVEYTYDQRDHMHDIRAYTVRDVGTRTLLTHNRYLFDIRGNLAKDYQSLGVAMLPYPDFNGDYALNSDDLGDFINCYFTETAEPGSCPGADFNQSGMVDPDDLGDFINAYFDGDNLYPYTGYAWDHANSDTDPAETGYTRLTGMFYPTHGETLSSLMARRAVGFAYGASPTSPDSLLGRMTSIDNTPGSGFVGGGNIAQFEYMGVSRRAAMRLGVANGVPTVSQNLRFGSEVGLSGLDGFGRLGNLKYVNAAGDTLFQGMYGYDRQGNRTSAEIVQATDLTSPLTDHHQQNNTYDALNRLVGTELKTLSSLPGTPPVVSGTPRTDAWTLDLVGNWAGQTTTPGREVTGALPFAALDPEGVITRKTQAVDGRNEITGIAAGDAANTETLTTLYDAAGSLIFEGTTIEGSGWFYQYDAWARLVQVNRAHVETIQASGGGSSGNPPATTTVIVPEALVKQFAYDGLGRLVSVRSPLGAEPTEGIAPDASNVPLREERCYYEGIRRVQSMERDLTLPDAESGVRSSEHARLAREYVWGPGDGHAGVDELLAMFDGAAWTAAPDPEASIAVQAKPWFTLQDAGGDVVALCDTGGAAVPASTQYPNGAPNSGRVVGQWTYEAYGSVLHAAALHPHPELHCGHKGLFVDRLDTPIETTGGDESPLLAARARVLAYARNRTYDVANGRWLQTDPNATATSTLSFAWHGSVPPVGSSPLEVGGLFGDGANLFQYVRSTPPTLADPIGLTGIGGEGVGLLESLLVRVFTTQRALSIGKSTQGLLNAAIYEARLGQALAANGAALLSFGQRIKDVAGNFIGRGRADIIARLSNGRVVMAESKAFSWDKATTDAWLFWRQVTQAVGQSGRFARTVTVEGSTEQIHQRFCILTGPKSPGLEHVVEKVVNLLTRAGYDRVFTSVEAFEEFLQK